MGIYSRNRSQSTLSKQRTNVYMGYNSIGYVILLISDVLIPSLAGFLMKIFERKRHRCQLIYYLFFNTFCSFYNVNY
jgi:hypothetical protein